MAGRTPTGRNYSTLPIQNSDVACLHLAATTQAFLGEVASLARNIVSIFSRSVNLPAVTFSDL